MRAPFFFLLVLASACDSPTESGDETGTEDAWYLPIPVPEILDRRPKASEIIYLNREGAVLVPGVDEASLNRSSIVESIGLDSVAIPAFRGSHARWSEITTCIRGHFERYDVQIVEQRPTVPGYMMAVLGGRPTVLGSEATHEHGRVLGLAPFNGQPVENAVVLIFTREIRGRSRQACETAAMEIAHAFGLDHTYDCHDLMTYRRRCGRRSFVDEQMACGEHEERACVGPSETQSSHGRLLEVLGAPENENEE